MAKKPTKEAPSQELINEAVERVVANVQRLVREAGTSALLSAWRIGNEFKTLAAFGIGKGGYGTQAINRAIEKMSHLSDSTESISAATAYRYRTLASMYSEESIVAMGAVGISSTQALAAGELEGVTHAHILAVVERITKKEIGRSTFAEALREQTGAGRPAGLSGAVDVDPTSEDSGSRPRRDEPKAASTSADSVALDDAAKPAAKRTRKSKAAPSVRKTDEVSVDDSIDVMATKTLHGLEDAVKTMGDLLILVSKLDEVSDGERDKQAEHLRRLQHQLKDLIAVGAKVKEKLFQYEVKEAE